MDKQVTHQHGQALNKELGSSLFSVEYL
jgi:hypothetical protein